MNTFAVFLAILITTGSIFWSLAAWGGSHRYRREIWAGCLIMIIVGWTLAAFDRRWVTLPAWMMNASTQPRSYVEPVIEPSPPPPVLAPSQPNTRGVMDAHKQDMDNLKRNGL